MFSYRHGFHAGNHADVLKHAVLLHVIDYYQRKESPFWIIDTHAGAGVYELNSDWAKQSGEAVAGIKRLFEYQGTLPDLLQRYVDYIKDCNHGSEGLNLYPGSPWIALSLLRERDRLRLFELHPTEIDELRHFIEIQDNRVQRQTQVIYADGFKGLWALLPPPTRRGIIFMDPSYESKADYHKVLDSLQGSLKRFATGCYVIWYPEVKRVEKQNFLQQLERKIKQPYLHVSLALETPPKEGIGFYGSGLVIVNPPYTLESSLKEAMPLLVKQLSQGPGSCFELKSRP